MYFVNTEKYMHILKDVTMKNKYQYARFNFNIYHFSIEKSTAPVFNFLVGHEF